MRTTSARKKHGRRGEVLALSEPAIRISLCQCLFASIFLNKRHGTFCGEKPWRDAVGKNMPGSQIHGKLFDKMNCTGFCCGVGESSLLSYIGETDATNRRRNDNA